MPTIDQITNRLASYQPQLRDATTRAAVAVVLREQADRVEVLFIKRAEHDRDPWSGHMAFPGGRLEAGDPGPREAAQRETLEEVGLSLAEARHLGRLDDLSGRGHAEGLVVSAHVFHLEASPAAPFASLRPNAEVDEAFWFPLGDLSSPERQIDCRHPAVSNAYPGIVVGRPDRHVVWGLTYRFLEDLMRIVGRPLQERWDQTLRAGA